jgi:hypothetical protein
MEAAQNCAETALKFYGKRLRSRFNWDFSPEFQLVANFGSG